MPKLHGRGSFALAALGVALVWSGTADAQIGPNGEGESAFNSARIGPMFEVLDLPKAERRLDRLQAKIARDAANGNADAVDRDARQIDQTRFRIGMDAWLIRKNLCQQNYPYPPLRRVDSMTCAAMISARRPPGTPSIPILPDLRLR